MAKRKTKRHPGVLIVKPDEKTRTAAAASQAIGARK